MTLTRLEQRVNKGRKALALARQKGLDTATWEEELTKLEQEQKEAAETVRRTEQLLATRGWCLWQCSTLDDDIIAVVRDESVQGLPAGYTVYTKAELAELTGKGLPPSTLRLAHEAKKHYGAKVSSVEPRKESINEALKIRSGKAEL